MGLSVTVQRMYTMCNDQVRVTGIGVTSKILTTRCFEIQ